MHRVACITSLREPYYTQVKEGEKTWEIRLNKGEWKEVGRGDWVLAFRKDGKGEFVIFEVLERRDYTSFRAALEDVGFRNAVPHAEDVEEALKPYAQIYGTGEGKEVIALKIRVVGEFCGEISPDKLKKYLSSFRGERG